MLDVEALVHHRGAHRGGDVVVDPGPGDPRADPLEVPRVVVEHVGVDEVGGALVAVGDVGVVAGLRQRLRLVAADAVSLDQLDAGDRLERRELRREFVAAGGIRQEYAVERHLHEAGGDKRREGELGEALGEGLLAFEAGEENDRLILQDRFELVRVLDLGVEDRREVGPREGHRRLGDDGDADRPGGAIRFAAHGDAELVNSRRDGDLARQEEVVGVEVVWREDSRPIEGDRRGAGRRGFAVLVPRRHDDAERLTLEGLERQRLLDRLASSSDKLTASHHTTADEVQGRARGRRGRVALLEDFGRGLVVTGARQGECQQRPRQDVRQASASHGMGVQCVVAPMHRSLPFVMEPERRGRRDGRRELLASEAPAIFGASKVQSS